MTEEEKRELTNARSKAVRDSLNNEKNYVLEGKGTRDWTKEQQQDILDGERPKDENGVAYQGHHMKSVSGHEIQASNANNIQWLKRSEHYDAHDKNFHNPTNGYYNPDTGETTPFRRYPVAPEAQELSNPIAKQEGQSESTSQSESTNQSNLHGK